MAISRVKTWLAAEVLYAADLNAEFDNILNNALPLVSPWTANMDANGFRLIGLALGTVGNPTLQLTGDTNTGIYSSAADTVDVATGGVRAASFGASSLLVAAPEDARTTTVDVMHEYRSTTSGAPAAGIGTGVLYSAESADENPSELGRLDWIFTDITAASEDSVLDVLLRVAGAAVAAVYRLEATAGNRLTITHAITAARTLTVPDLTGSVYEYGKGADIASAATLTLGADGNYFDVTGTTGITAISARPAGDVVVLQFDGALTITHNATTLALIGAANITTAAANVLTFVSEGGGNWRQVARNAAGTAAIVNGNTRVTADFTTTSTTFVDVTTHTITMTTTARRVLLLFSGNHTNSGINRNDFTFDIDGTDAGGTAGLQSGTMSGADAPRMSCTFHYLTDVLTAASHTFKVNAQVSAGTMTIQGTSNNTFAAMELST